MSDILQVKSLEEAAVHIASLNARCRSLELEVRALSKVVDTFYTPLWKKAWFLLDGWPLYRIVEKRAWRPWHHDD